MLGTPLEYLVRLFWQNLIFGDDIKIVGICYEDEQLSVITSQPWIDVHDVRPNPSKEEIDEYMGRFAFSSISLDLDTPHYYSEYWDLVALDAHDRNIARDQEGRLAAIDLVIGPPTDSIIRQYHELRNSSEVPY